MDAALANADAPRRLQITSLTHLQTTFKSVIKQKKKKKRYIIRSNFCFWLQHVMFHVLSTNCLQGFWVVQL